jgi:hypothetical protein
MAQLNSTKSSTAAVEKLEAANAVQEGNTGITGVVTGSTPMTGDRQKLSSVALEMNRKRDRELVKGVFKYHEQKGGTISFMVKLHKGDKIERYTLTDDCVYTIPRGVAKHLNTNTSYPVYENTRETKMNSFGEVAPLAGLIVKKKLYRTGFYPLDFVDVGESEQQANLVTVERPASLKQF